MAMFGKSAARFDPSGLSGSDRAVLFGAMLKDVGGALNGSDSNALLQAQGMMAQRQQLAAQRAMAQQAAGLFGGAGRAAQAVTNQGGEDISAAFGSAGPTRLGGFNPRDAAAQLAQFAAQGLDISPYAKLAELSKPNVKIGPDGEAYDESDPSVIGRRFANRSAVNDTIVDLNDPNNTNRVVPKAPVAGAMPVYDNLGRVTDWTLPNGARQVIGDASQADTTGKTFGTVFNRPNGDGSTTPTLGRDMFAGGAGGTGGYGGAGGPGRTQSPDDAAYAGDLAKAAAGQYTSIQSAGQKAATNITNFTRMNQLLDGLNTGSLAPSGLALQKALASVGIQGNPAWGRVEAADALSKKLALDAMGGSLGAGFSNADRGFVEAMNPSIVNTPQGRKQMIEFGIARAKREQFVAEKARQWNQRAGRLDKPDRNGKTFFDYLDAYAASNPLVKQ